MSKFKSDLIDRDYVYRQNDADLKCPHYTKCERRVIVCLCGSTRFYDEFQRANYRETMAGKIVLSIGCDTKSDQALGLSLDDKAGLDELHLDKINLADEVLILNVGGYVGDSTRREAVHAWNGRKNVRWLEPFAVPADLAHIGNSLSDGPAVHRDKDNDPDYVGS